MAGPWVVFDCALSGKEALAAQANHRALQLDPGSWEVASKEESPGAGTQLLVVRLRWLR